MQALHDLQLHVDDRLVAAQATIGSDVIRRAVATPITVPVTVLALTVGVVILCVRALLHAEWTVLDMLALVAFPRALP